MLKLLHMRWALCFAVAAILCCQLICAHRSSSRSGNLSSQSNRNQELPKLFQFDYYKSIFKKSYANLAEELVRKKIFLARAFRAFISGVAYKFRKTTYFLSLNQLSDRTRYEIRKTKTLHDPTKDLKGGSRLQKQPDYIFESEEDVRKGIESIKAVAAKKGEDEIVDELMKFAKSSDKGRRKRSTHNKIREDFSLNQLVDRRRRVEIAPKAKAKIDTKPISNNPNYQPPEMTSMGSERPTEQIGQNIRDHLMRIFPFDRKQGLANDVNPLKSLYALLDGMSNTVSYWLSYSAETNEAETLLTNQSQKVGRASDKVYFDHRNGGCMLPARDQMDCGACYAFAVTAFFEWLHCKQTGKLVAFSEQYMIDCGPKTRFNESLDGCDGGVIPMAALFYQVYGADIATKYPYRGEQGECPYDPENESSMGFLRFHGQPARFLQITMREAEKLIKNAPVVIVIGSEGDFAEYGGGVHSGEKCCMVDTPADPCEKHGVLLVGHGQQDGQEYWLIRNSYSTVWGEEGYYKLNKKSKCIMSSAGLIFGTTDGRNFALTSEEKKRLS